MIRSGGPLDCHRLDYERLFAEPQVDGNDGDLWSPVDVARSRLDGNAVAAMLQAIRRGNADVEAVYDLATRIRSAAVKRRAGLH
jgi:hypothetical protein